MTEHRAPAADPRVPAALAERQRRIAARFPRAAFAVVEGAEPDGVYLRATVDVADMSEVADLVLERLAELRVEEGLPVYLLPVRPIERVAAQLRERLAAEDRAMAVPVS